MRRPTLHYIAANAFAIATWGSAICVTILMIWYSVSSFTALSNIVVLGLLLLGILVALPLGWILGALFVAPILCRIAAKIQGAPFHQGEKVRILIGAHRDTIARIDQVWDERFQVVVIFDKQGEHPKTGYFQFHEVCREQSGAMYEEISD